MPKISDEVRSERRQALIEAAWRCAARQGYHAMTVDDVCLEAGVSKGAFYGYFDSKQHLLLTLLEEDAVEVDEIVADLSGRRMAPVERLRAFAEAMVEHASDPARIQVRADLWSAMLTDPLVREHFVETVRRRRSLLRDSIERSFDPGQLHQVPPRAIASCLLALADGLTLHAALDPTAFRWPNVRRAIDRMLTTFDGSGADHGRAVRARVAR